MSTHDSLFSAVERASSEPDAELRVQKLLALNKAAITITGELELDALLQRIVDAARDLVGCDYSALGVLGSDGFIERFPTSGISESDKEKIGAPPRGHGLLGVMLRAGRSIRIPEMSADPRRVGFPPNHPPMISLLGVPIFVQDVLVGSLYLTDKHESIKFSEEDEWLVQLLATHAATALTNARLHAENLFALQRIRQERTRSQALFQVTRSINRSVQLDEVVSLITQAATNLPGTDAMGATLYLVNGSDNNTGPRLVRHAGPGFTAEEDASALINTEDRVVHEALQAGTTHIEQLPQDVHEGVSTRVSEQRPMVLLALPMCVGEIDVGVLSIYSADPQAFEQDEVALYEAFASVAGAAIFNANLYGEAQRSREVAEREGERLRELEQMKDEFLSTAAHELRTPLTTIRMSAGLVQEQMRAASQLPPGSQSVDPRLLDLLGLVVEGSERMHSLVNDLLDLTRLEQGRSGLAFTTLDMREVAQASIEAINPLFNSKKQALSVRLPEAYCAVRGDRQRLEQVLINLLSNAHKYSPEGARIELRVVRAANECLTSVRDTGAGVPAGERESIFERFVRSSLHRQDRTASTGLGLPIARTIAEMHGGRVWMEPAPDGGSIFTLALPLADR